MPKSGKERADVPDVIEEEASDSDLDEDLSDSEMDSDLDSSVSGSELSDRSINTISSRTGSLLTQKRQEVEQNIAYLNRMAKELRKNGDAFDNTDLNLVLARAESEKARLHQITQMEDRFSRRLKKLSGILDKREGILNTLASSKEGRRAFKNMPDLMESLVERQAVLEKKYTEMSLEVSLMLSEVQKI